MDRSEKVEDLPDFGEIKRVVNKYEEKMKKDLDELEERKLLIAQEEKASKKRIHEEKEKQKEILQNERDNAMLKVEKKAKLVEEEKRHWEVEKSRVKATKTFEKIVTLNVGGSRYTTTLSTLTKYPDSMLGAMFSGRHALVQQEDGSYFIDRDGETFSHVLSYLRDSNIVLTIIPILSNELRIRLRYEAGFYQLQDLETTLGLMDLHEDYTIYSLLSTKTKYHGRSLTNVLDYGKASTNTVEQNGSFEQFNSVHSAIRVEEANIKGIQKKRPYDSPTYFMESVTFLRCNLDGVSFVKCLFQRPVSFEGCLMQGTIFKSVGGLVTHKVHFTPWQVSQAVFDPELLEALKAKGCIY